MVCAVCMLHMVLKVGVFPSCFSPFPVSAHMIAANLHQRLPGEEEDYVQCGAQAGGDGRRELEGLDEYE